MPTYEYRCQSCAHELETVHKMSDPPLRDCPVCGRPELERLISATTFQLKGGGWYKDLYSAPKTSSKKSGSEAA